jgi:hypothetical protein
LRWVPESGASAEVRSKAELLLRDSNLIWDEDPAGVGFPRSAGLYLRDVEGRILSLPLPNPSDATAVLRGVEMAVTSPLRERVYREGLRAYALVLLLEGTDGEANARVRQDVDSAITATARLLSSMPKPVETPPQMVAVSLKEQAAEKVLVWGLGLDPASTDSPRVVLVFGRGRRLGSPLEGPLITQTALRDRLLLIGQDCECDLDRAWLKGPLLPGRWDESCSRPPWTRWALIRATPWCGPKLAALSNADRRILGVVGRPHPGPRWVIPRNRSKRCSGQNPIPLSPSIPAQLRPLPRLRRTRLLRWLRRR